MNDKTDSDLAFEEYLLVNGHIDFEHDREWDGIATKPDYTVSHQGDPLLFEVKQLDFKKPRSGLWVGDPYRRIREKISAAQKQLAPFKGKLPCSVVIGSNDGMVDIHDPQVMLAAMYGDLAFTIPFSTDPNIPAAGERDLVFHERGKMFRKESMTIQNTNINAVISLYPLGAVRLRQKLAPEIPDENLAAIGLPADIDPNSRIMGVLVFENIYAEKPLPRSIFSGPFDMRWGRVGDRINLVHNGWVMEKLSSNETSL